MSGTSAIVLCLTMPVTWAMGFSFISPNSRALDKETGNTDTLNSAECILRRPTTVFKALQWLENGGGKIQSLPSNNTVQLGGERRGRYSAAQCLIQDHGNECQSYKQCGDRDHFWFQETMASNKISWSTGHLMHLTEKLRWERGTDKGFWPGEEYNWGYISGRLIRWQHVGPAGSGQTKCKQPAYGSCKQKRRYGKAHPQR